VNGASAIRQTAEVHFWLPGETRTSSSPLQLEITMKTFWASHFEQRSRRLLGSSMCPSSPGTNPSPHSGRAAAARVLPVQGSLTARWIQPPLQQELGFLR